tara:strand:+ start:3690 stop:4232 length:543 start_codon:yes stop_codon:yes gene_type:complete
MTLPQGLKGKLFKQIRRVPGGTGFLQKGGAGLIGQSLPGGIITGALTTLATGNPLAGALVGGTDVISSSLLARGLASDRLRQGLTGIAGGKDINLAGRFVKAVDPKTGQLLPKFYQASMPQNLAMLTGSVGATLGIEPLFYPQNSVQQQQLAQMKYMNNLSPHTSDGTMYQLQGIPMRSV